ncbi:hypothetical protein LGM85_22555 [Burkholderia multivorans]|uniref:hypothetical protein n=2 Tax=Burkholderia multivorans TaxID=87883 RepID=UPI001FC87E47|nr:hypothetical protein [Burkholderia multivorans]MCA8486717.1 hypothetical protein [Burkholderia multivorans]
MDASTMTQREMLENAAKTMGLTLIWSTDEDLSPREEGSRLVFNPLLSDGAAYRLLVANDVILSFAGAPPSFAIAESGSLRRVENIADYTDKGAAGRAAILWVAAERGKSIVV